MPLDVTPEELRAAIDVWEGRVPQEIAQPKALLAAGFVIATRMFADGNRRSLSLDELEAIKADLADRGAAPNETNITTFALTADGLADYAEVVAHTLGQILAYQPNSYVGAHVANDSEVADEEEMAAAAGAVYAYLKEQGMSAVGAAGTVAVTTAQVALDDGVPPEQMIRIAMEILMGAARRMRGRT